MKKIINYSGIPALILIAALAFMPISCSKEAVNGNTLPDNSSQLIKVSGEDVSVATKTTLNLLVTSWVASNDKVGIYSDLARTASSGGGTVIVNAQFTAVSTGVSSNFTGTMFWGTGITTNHTFYAYYPYNIGYSGASNAVPITLSDNQTQLEANSNAHIGALDFMVATPVTVTSPGNTNQVANEVHLNYNHVFTVLEFQIKGSGQLKAVKLVVPTNPIAFSSGTINLNQTPATNAAYTFASQTGTTTQAVVTLTSAATLTATNADTKVYMVINPGTQTGNCLIGLSSDGTTWTYISKAAPEGGFLRGKKYVVTIDKADAGAAPAIDPDGNVFGIVTIGTQVWMASNLKTTKYNDGTDIPNVTVNATWTGLTTGAYCWYNSGTEGSPVYINTYGRLYNGYAVKTAKLCPTGWHVPTDVEWTNLTNYLSENLAGNKLKEAGTSHWAAPNTGATNETGFTALPGGYRFTNGTFYDIGTNGNWWSSTEYAASPIAWYRDMSYGASNVSRSNANETYGHSVRCLRD